MPSNHANKITGRLGEDIACNFLEKLGYKILAKTTDTRVLQRLTSWQKTKTQSCLQR